MLEPLEAWSPTNSPLKRLVSSPKRHVVDLAVEARLVGLVGPALLSGRGPTAIARDGTFRGSLFESLAALSLRLLAQAAETRVSHVRTKDGEREIAFVIDAAVITTGRHAYRRPDGSAVVPLALLGP